MAKQQATAGSTEKLQEALELLNEAAHEKREELKALMSGKYQNLKETVVGVEGRVAEHINEAAERLAHARDLTQERLKDAGQAVDRKVHEEPWKALGIGALTAFLLGYIIGRK